MVRVVTRPDKAPQDEEEEILASEAEAEDDEDEEDDDEAEEDPESDLEMPDAAAIEAGVDEEAERPQGMEIDNGVPSTSDRVCRHDCSVPPRRKCKSSTIRVVFYERSLLSLLVLQRHQQFSLNAEFCCS